MIHKYYLNGFYIVLDVNSGAVHLVDKLTYKMLDIVTPPLDETAKQNAIQYLKEEYEEEEIAESFVELKGLFDAGQLFSIDDYKPFSDMKITSPIKALCLNVSHDCNLRCDYCFAGKGAYCGQRMMMPLETGKKAIDFLIEKSAGRHNLEVDFFGGEPTMNFAVVKELVLYARSLEKPHDKNFRFTITTNGVLLDDEMIDFINQEMSNVVLSIDGRPETNNRVRKTINGKGSFDLMAGKLKHLVDKRGEKEYYARGTFTKYNLDFTNDVLFLNDFGFDQLSVEPVVADPKCDYALTEADLPAIFEEYERLSKIIIEREHTPNAFNFFHFMIDLDQGPCAIKRLRGCGSGNEYIAITPDGDIFPCHQFVGHDEWKMGNINDGTFDLAMKKQFEKANVYNKPDCMKCWAKFYCSGGCNANNMMYAGDILKSYSFACELEKKRLECAIMIKAALAQKNEEAALCH